MRPFPGGPPQRAENKRWLVALSFLVLTAGCADVARQASLDQELLQLRSELNAQAVSIRRSGEDVQKLVRRLEERAQTRDAETQKQLVALSARTESLKIELSELATELEEISQRVDLLSRQAKTKPTPQTAGAKRQRPGEAGSPETSSEPTELYQAAYTDFSKGSYALAIAAFQEFLRQFPDSDLADNAQYWIGESYFSLARTDSSRGQPDEARAQLERAAVEFRKVIVNYPLGDKAPTAIYKEALALLDLKRQKLARARLQYIVDHFPQSVEAPLARERLATLGNSTTAPRRTE
ncbi:MAG: tetratricopeptide repeat protein [Candidatus Methylomirabilia bacterium]